MIVRPSHHTLAVSFAVIISALFVFRAQAETQSSTMDGCSPRPLSELTVNVKDKGAKGDGKTDDSKAIQAAIDEVTGTGGTVYIPNGTYMVRGTTRRRVTLKSKMVLKLADDATLKVIPNASKRYSVLRVRGVNDVAIIGGTLLGDRAKHKGTKGDGGMGISIGRESKRVSVVGVTAKDMWGDGFYIIGASHVSLCSVSSIHNRRQGLSVISGTNLLIRDSLFAETRGTRPGAGIDLEPDNANHRIAKVRIERSTFRNNKGGGIMVSGKRGTVERVEIIENVFENNRPILIENAPGIKSTKICNNRSITRQEKHATQDFNAYAEPAEMVALQMDCNDGQDMRFEKNRITKKKK